MQPGQRNNTFDRRNGDTNVGIEKKQDMAAGSFGSPVPRVGRTVRSVASDHTGCMALGDNSRAVCRPIVNDDDLVRLIVVLRYRSQDRLQRSGSISSRYNE
jgi:hypothetical protein